MKILGYSERGIINSLIFSIVESNNNELMYQFIRKMGVSKINDSEKPIGYEILLEQSFSDFGDADLVIIMDYVTYKKVIFIEGKVKTIQKNSWSLQTQYNRFDKKDEGGKKVKYPGYSSNLFFQLYLKSLLFENREDLIGEKDYFVNCGFRDRKIGNNKIVEKALKKIAVCDEAFYVGLVPSSKKENDKFNEQLDYKIHFLSWETIYDFCKDNEKLEKVLGIFEYNKGQIY